MPQCYSIETVRKLTGKHAESLSKHTGMTVEVGRVNVGTDREVYSLTYAENENQSTVFPGKLNLIDVTIAIVHTCTPSSRMHALIKLLAMQHLAYTRQSASLFVCID